MIPVKRGRYIGVYCRTTMGYRLTLFDSNTTRSRTLDVSDINYSVLNNILQVSPDTEGMLILVDKGWTI